MAEPAGVAFLGVARIEDKAVLATCFDKKALNEEKTGFENALAQMLESGASIYPGWREQLECRECDGMLYAFADHQGVCIVAAGIRDAKYPERVALQLLREMLDKVRNTQGDEMLADARAGSLSTPLRKIFRDLMRTYSDPGSQDKATEVREKVDQLKGIMQDNVKRILETHVTMDQLQNSSASMSSQANQFLKQSVDLRRQVQLRNLKIKVIFGGCVVALLLYLAMPFLDF